MERKISDRNNKIKQIIFAILTISIFVIIFNFSNQDAEESEGLSSNIAKSVVDFLQKIHQFDSVNKEMLLIKTDVVVRKLAHFSLYTVVGIMLMSFLSTIDTSKSTRVTITVIIGIIYAMSDEIHQIFTPGRTAHFTDVMIDTGVVLFGILVFVCIEILIAKIIKIVEKNEKE